MFDLLIGANQICKCGSGIELGGQDHERTTTAKNMGILKYNLSHKL
jgi:hypothetical protein